MESALRALTGINLDDLVASFGWQDRPLPARLLRMLFRGPARKFARQILAFDRYVGLYGLPDASARTLRGYVREMRTFGRERVPDGPILVLANHPGMTDTLALFAAIGRRDLRIIALDRPFLQSLPNATSHLYYVSDEPDRRIRAVRQAATHLKSGGAVLTFPAGKIEPDPAVYPGALGSLADWTDSAGVFLRLAPRTRIVPALVSGVLWEPAVKHPLVRVKKIQAEREKLGAAFQLLAQVLFDLRPVVVTVRFGEPLSIESIGSNELPAIHAAVLQGMRALIETPPSGPGTNALAAP